MSKSLKNNLSLRSLAGLGSSRRQARPRLARLTACSFLLTCLASTALSAPVNWTGASGNWNVATNWSSNPSFPAAADDVTISVAGLQTVTFTGTAPVTSATVNSITSDENLTISGGSLTVTNGFGNTAATTISGGALTLNGASTLASLTQSGGSLAGTGTVTVTGASTITFGDHRGTGTTILQGASTISSSGLRLDGGRTLRNESTLTWSGGGILFNNTFNGVSGGAGSGTINNIAGATFVASGDFATTINASNFGGADTGADALITNAGTFRKSGSSAGHTTTVDVAFNNTGTV
ncbi:MAG: hypothetical protein JNK67_17065, partial [Alphaproteobacteria bacterium]|nr:hypothetical protein [Alphaproteobacteria bacterium]